MSKTSDRRPTELSGVGLSPGVAVGVAYKVEPQVGAFFRVRIEESERAEELERFHQALKESRRQLERAKQKFEAEVGVEHSYIIDAHLLILEDRQLLEEIESKIDKELQSSERAVREAAEGWLAAYRSLDDPFFQERGSDLEEVVERIVANLMQLDSHTHTGFPEDVILVAPEVSLLLLAEYPLERVKGLVLKKGGRTSHGIIVARSYQIPVVSGVEEIDETIRTGDVLIVDGDTGAVRLQPLESQVKSSRARMREEKKRQLVRREDQSPCLTKDGRRVHLYANAEIGSEVQLGLRLGAEGIGLFRSEYVYMLDKEDPVGEEEQFSKYRKLAEEVGDRPAVIRTLDLGNETHPGFSKILGETDSVLGLRGIRLSLQYPDIFKTQLRAVLRAGVHGNLKVVIPMVSSVEEVLQGRKLIAQVQEELAAEAIPVAESIEVGVMLEVPAAIVILEAICRNADFLAVGSNDLIQYTLAADRGDDRLSYLSNPLHPAVLKSLSRISEVTSAQGRPVFVCGEIAANPFYACLLVGMGFRHLSMNPFAIPEVKGILGHIDYQSFREIVGEILPLSTVQEIEACVAKHFATMEPYLADQLTVS